MQEVVCKLVHGNIPTMSALPVLGRFSKNSALGLSALPSLNFSSKTLMSPLRKWMRVMSTDYFQEETAKNSSLISFHYHLSPLLTAARLNVILGSLSWRRASTVLQTQQLVQLQEKIKALNRKGTTGICRAGLEDDAPFAVAIAASVLSTLVLPFEGETEQEANKGLSPLGGDDVRYAAMGIISFIPLFNWLVWVFAWLDTRKQRYLIYAIVYLAPYLRSGLSVSPEDSWLPLASVLACIIHVQLDISASSEGDQNMNISKVLFTGTQVKQMRERADTLLLRLQRLADKPAGATDSEGEKLTTAEDISRVEMEQWDEKLARSKAEDDARDAQL